MALAVVLALASALTSSATGLWDAGDALESERVGARARRKPRLRFAVIGDQGSGSRHQTDVAKKMCRWRRRHPFDLVVTTGDNIYPRGAPEDFEEKFFKPYACLLSNGVRFRAVLGNHDVDTDNGQPQLDEPAFGMKDRNYVVRRGGVRFVLADSNSFRRPWLRRATRARRGDRWTIAVFHHPVYSPGVHHGSTPGLRPWLPRLLRKRGVDLVLQGHDHNFALTKPLKGIRYIVTGGGGDKLYGCTKKWFSAKCRKRWHFLYVIATPRRLQVRAVSVGSGVFHRLTTKGIAPRRA